ncbi:dihydrodipicolinate synthase family protein [Termitidicoccus mucosus]|uniref:Dihydrodipicolinate synthase family protein n=1 Tax=Termitidicoccus mucosus TaxID=1184151 RepID=A0A178IMF1_9BACT|nr:dihydrodipicolinate synthase family protein [Opitutaceae bacterium TSB47]
MNRQNLPKDILASIARGAVIPASPLALDSTRRLDERRQRALMRYYIDAGAGGVAVGMHFTQFEIRKPGIDLFEPVLRICSDEIDRYASATGRSIIKVAGINGRTPEALKQAEQARELGYHTAIVSMAAFGSAMEQELIHHVRELAKVMPLFGFYLLTGVGGIKLPYHFWRELVEVENVVGIKIAPFDRYGTVDVVRALADSGRSEEITLYTGNDDSIIYDLITPYRFGDASTARTVRIRGGLLGQWGCWTKRAVELHERLLKVIDSGEPISPELLTLSAQITDANAALFDPAHDFRGSIPGVNEILRRQGLLEGIWTLKRDEVLSPGQLEEIDRVCAAYPHLTDDEFVRANLNRWLS